MVDRWRGEDGWKSIRARLAAHHRLRLGELTLLEGGFAGNFGQLVAYRVELLTVDRLGPHTIGIVRRQFVQPVLHAVMLDREVGRA